MRASDFRYAHVLPAAVIDRFAGRAIKAIRFLPSYMRHRLAPWWKLEEHIEIDFRSDLADDRPAIDSKCSACGQCCKNIPTHQIAIYMSPKELNLAKDAGHNVLTRGDVTIQDVNFAVLSVTPEGDCSMLGPRGCTLGNLKPLWCKIYHCERFAGRDYQFEEKK